MSLRNRIMTRQAQMEARIERALGRLHVVLRLTELRAPAHIIERVDALLEKSLAEIDVSASELFALYPRFRIVQTVRDAAEQASMSDEGDQDESLHELD